MEKEKIYKLILSQEETNNLFKHGLGPLRDIKILMENKLKLQVKNSHYKINPLEYEYFRRHSSWVPLENYKESLVDKEVLKNEMGKLLGKRTVLTK